MALPYTARPNGERELTLGFRRYLAWRERPGVWRLREVRPDETTVVLMDGYQAKWILASWREVLRQIRARDRQ